MPSKLPLLTVPLVLAALLFAVSTAHAAPVSPTVIPLAFEEELEGEEVGEAEEGEVEVEEGGCEEAQEELDEGELSAAEVKEICEEEKPSEHQATHPQQGKAKHHRHPHKKACQRRAGKRHCPHRPHRSRRR